MNNSRTFLVIILFSFFLYAGSTLSVAAQAEESGLRLEAEAGFDGYYKDGVSWVPIRVRVANDGPAIEGYVQVEVEYSGPDDDMLFRTPVSLPTQSDKEVALYVYLAGFRDSLPVTLTDEAGNVLLETEAAVDRLSTDTLLYAVVSDEPSPLTFLENVAGTHPAAAVALMDVGDLPAVGPAWNPLDVLILSNVDSGELTPEQQEALRGWVGTGGQLVVTGGSNWQPTTSAVSELLPVRLEGDRVQEDIAILHTLSAEPFRDPGPYVIASSQLRNGEVLLFEEDVPLLARQAYGAGAVYFLALDPAQAPLLDWRGNPLLWSYVADRAPQLPIWASGVQNGYAANNAVSRLPGLALPSVLWLVLFLVVYVVIVGPLNYWLLRRMGHREWAWFTIPGIILFFALLAYLTGFRLRGDEVILNQMAIAYGHVDGEQVRANSILGVYSPRRATYDVVLPEQTLVHPFDQNFGGLGGPGNLEAVTWGSDVTLEQVRVDVSGVESFIADSYQPQPAIDGRATLTVEGNDATLEVNVQNNSDLLFENAGILFNARFFSLGDLAPGDSAAVSEALTGVQSPGYSGGLYGGGPYYPGMPFQAHYEAMLGTPDYMRDPEVFPRYQLLESLNYYDPGVDGLARNRVTLVAWSEDPQLDAGLAGESFANRQTTLYFLELPVEQTATGGEGVVVPLELLDWRVVAESGGFTPSLTNFYMTPGWIELEFEPTSLYAGMDVTNLDLVMRRPPEQTGSQPPQLSLWDWQQEAWVSIPNEVWGRMTVADFDAYVDSRNRVRLRLQNEAGYGIEISEFYPALTGDIE